MTLNSFWFVVMYAALCVLMFLLQLLRKSEYMSQYATRMQKAMLLIFSYAFIYCANWKFCVCVLLYSVVTYYFGIYIDRCINKRKQILTLGIVSTVGMLVYFKYCNFFIDSIMLFFGCDKVLLNIVIPIGISFYSFSGIAYLIDVYTGACKVEKNIFSVALYISFFGKITAGPIVRPKLFLDGYHNYRGINASSFSEGVQIFVFGLFKKMVLADRLGVFVDDVFFVPSAYNTGTIILAVISYSLQIYYDFSGYSDMAIGVSKMIGFDFLPNFNLPYMAKGMSDFWKRWHISLSSWFQDYMYIPLGGSRKGSTRTYLNLLFVMLVSGLWHGAGVTFLVWGMGHGIGSCISRMVSRCKIASEKWFGYLRICVTYTYVSLLWVVFRAKDMQNALSVWKGIFTIHTGINQPYTWSFVGVVCLIFATGFAVRRSKLENSGCLNGYYPIMDLTKIFGLVTFFVFSGLTILFGYYGNTAFIYGKF